MRTIRIACQVKDCLPIDEIHPFQGELKSLSKESYAKLRKEILETGFAFPLFVWKSPEGTVFCLGGHQRLRALQNLRDAEQYVLPPIPVVYIDADSFPQAKRRILQDASQYGRVEKQGLYEFMSDAGINIPDLELSFDLPSIDPKKFGDEFFNDPKIEEDPTPEPPAVAVSQLGDIWNLGNHRLMCGDSSNSEAIAKLMGNTKASLVFTDPPYGVNYQSNMRVKSSKFDVIENDDVFLTDWIGHLPRFSTGWVFVWTSWKVLARWIEISKPIGDLTNMVVWNKGGGGLGDLDGSFSSDFEVALVFNRGASLTGKRIGSVWSVGKDAAAQYVHPTQKPVALGIMAINSCTMRGNAVLDLFGGSGSTLMACENTARKGFIMELDPRYCDVILTRWAQATGNDPVRESDGAAWSSLK